MFYDDLCDTILTEMLSRHRALLTKYPDETDDSINAWEEIDPTASKMNVMKMVKIANNPNVKAFNNIEDARKLKDALPDPTKELTWTLNQIESGLIKKIDDKTLAKVGEYLKKYTELSRKKGWSGPKSINEIKTYNQLIELVDAVAGKQVSLKFPDLQKPGAQVQWAGTIGSGFWTIVKIPPINTNFPLASSYFNEYAKTSGFCIGREATFKHYAATARNLPDQQHAGFYLFFRDKVLQGVLTPYQEFKDGDNRVFTANTPNISELRIAALSSLPEYYSPLVSKIGMADPGKVQRVNDAIDQYHKQCINAVNDDSVMKRVVENAYTVAASLAFRPKPGNASPIVCTYQEFVSNRWINPTGFQRFKLPRDIVDQFAHNALCSIVISSKTSTSLIEKLYTSKVAPMSKHTVSISIPGGQVIHANKLTYDDHTVFGVSKNQAFTGVPPQLVAAQSKFDTTVNNIAAAISTRMSAIVMPGEKAIPVDPAIKQALESVSQWNTAKSTKIPSEHSTIMGEQLFPSVFKIEI